MSKLRNCTSNPRIVVAAAAAHAAQLRAPISNPLLSPGLAPGIASPRPSTTDTRHTVGLISARRHRQYTAASAAAGLSRFLCLVWSNNHEFMQRKCANTKKYFCWCWDNWQFTLCWAPRHDTLPFAAGAVRNCFHFSTIYTFSAWKNPLPILNSNSQNKSK